MRIRSKLIVLIAVPLIALAVAAAFGFTSQSVRIETAEDASAAVGESQSAFSAILAIGDERLHLLGADVGTRDDLTEATDAAMSELGASTTSPETSEAVANVRTMIEESRSSDAAEGSAMLGAAADELLHLNFADADAYPTAESRNAAVVNHHAIESLQLREWAWIAYISAEEVDPNNISVLSADFAAAKFAINQTQAIDAQGGSTRIQTVLQSPAGLRLTELEISALDDLSEEQLTVETPEILGALADFRTEWGATVRGQTSALRGAVDDELLAANNLRSLFTLLAALGVVVLVGLIFVVYRSITNPLESLLDRASSVANEDLPNLVETLRHDDGTAELPVAEPIPVTTDDEIGELVAAFNDVQATAYDLATEQALGRRNVADMFVNLGRRNQQLLQRILAQLTELEQNEEDPDKLRDLFELDNVVTRMRRNAESLLALAGAQTTRQWSQPITIDNTVRAAFGEVEGYERIDVAELAEVRVLGSVVADITHLLAELLENALNFSEPTTSVVVNGRVEPEGYIITVLDQGIGMSQRELSDGNQRITDPPPLDQVPTRFLGLYVVGRLAERHGIRVQLTETSGGGIAAKVIVPNELVVTGEETSRSSAPARLVTETETETSPLEGEHDLDAELAEMTADAADDDSPSDPIVSNPTPDDGGGALPTRNRKNRGTGTAVAEIEKPVTAQAPATVDSNIDSDSELHTQSTIEAETDADTMSETETSESLEAEEAVGDPEDSANSADSEDSHGPETTAEPETASAKATPADTELGDLGLPVRKRGGALDETPTTTIDRASIGDRAATDSSPEAAGNFSSMISALTSGVARGLEESDQDDVDNDDSKDGNDQ